MSFNIGGMVKYIGNDETLLVKNYVYEISDVCGEFITVKNKNDNYIVATDVNFVSVDRLTALDFAEDLKNLLNKMKQYGVKFKSCGQFVEIKDDNYCVSFEE